MISLKQALEQATETKRAIGHFNFSDSGGFNGIIEATLEVSEEIGEKVPLILGTSGGEGKFVGQRQAAALVHSVREEHNHPFFLNADHGHSIQRMQAAVEAGYDAVLFDGGDLPWEENISKTRQVVELAHKKSEDIVVEGELGYIGSSSEVFEEIPEGAAISEDDLTTPEEAREFVEKTGVDLLAPAVGNIHGMFKNAPNPRLNIDRIRAIREAAGVPLVLHGGSGVEEEDFIAAIEAGVAIVHVNTEIRRAWRRGLERAFSDMPKDVTPYHLLPHSVEKIKKIIKGKLKLYGWTA